MMAIFEGSHFNQVGWHSQVKARRRRRRARWAISIKPCSIRNNDGIDFFFYYFLSQSYRTVYVFWVCELIGKLFVEAIEIFTRQIMRLEKYSLL